jgi:predicted NBD/HSP70 family sugar kinase
MTERYKSHTGKQIDVPAIFEKAAEGDKNAITVLDQTARYLAQGIAAIAAVANPEKVILGGSIGLRPEILSRVQNLMPHCFPYPVTVEASELGARAALIGAAAIGLGQLHNTLFGVDAPDGRISLPPAQAAALKEVAL